ncbi:MAG TPA: 4Fe-4S binding protein [Syntrophorhabdaceae bacterium]|nr:4Fe-4S binding protein [Syntrophorhabdaceae bacterium]HPU28815.1 4Fe-4S binding protein [Syntrophorhabdaceae bacterium]
MVPSINKEKCTGCGICTDICPPGAISIIDDKAFIEIEFCEECGFCAPSCPSEAIEIDFPTLYKR